MSYVFPFPSRSRSSRSPSGIVTFVTQESGESQAGSDRRSLSPVSIAQSRIRDTDSNNLSGLSVGLHESRSQDASRVHAEALSMETLLSTMGTVEVSPTTRSKKEGGARKKAAPLNPCKLNTTQPPLAKQSKSSSAIPADVVRCKGVRRGICWRSTERPTLKTRIPSPREYCIGGSLHPLCQRRSVTSSCPPSVAVRSKGYAFSTKSQVRTPVPPNRRAAVHSSTVVPSSLPERGSKDSDTLAQTTIASRRMLHRPSVIETYVDATECKPGAPSRALHADEVGPTLSVTPLASLPSSMTKALYLCKSPPFDPEGYRAFEQNKHVLVSFASTGPETPDDTSRLYTHLSTFTMDTRNAATLPTTSSFGTDAAFTSAIATTGASASSLRAVGQHNLHVPQSQLSVGADPVHDGSQLQTAPTRVNKERQNDSREKELQLVHDLHCLSTRYAKGETHILATGVSDEDRRAALLEIRSAGGGLYGLRTPPENVIFPSSSAFMDGMASHQEAVWRQKTSQELVTERATDELTRGVEESAYMAQMRAYRSRCSDDAVAATGETLHFVKRDGVEEDYPALFTNIRKYSLGRVHEASKSVGSPSAALADTEYSGKQERRDGGLLSASHPRAVVPTSTLVARTVLLRDPVSVLTCQPLLHDLPPNHRLEDRHRNPCLRIPLAMDAAFSPQSILRPEGAPSSSGVDLSYPAKVLLSAILYVRALGGFPTLLRVGPLMDSSPVIDKESCIEMVFWNPTREHAEFQQSILTRERDAERTSIPRNSMGDLLDNLMDWHPQTVASTHSSGRDGRTPSFSAFTCQSPSGTMRNRHGSEHILGTAAPQVSTGESRRQLRRSSYTAMQDAKGGGVPQPSPAVALPVPPRLRQQPFGAGAPTVLVKDAPATANGRGQPRIREAEDELCVVVRAVMAQKSSVYRFGKEEIVHVLPPLPSEEECLERRMATDTLLESLALNENNPIFKLLKDTNAKKAEERRKLAQQQRLRRMNARGPVSIDDNGKKGSADYGDLAVAILLSGEASQLSGVLPDAMELAALRYKVFSLQGYRPSDPLGVHLKEEEKAIHDAGNTADFGVDRSGDAAHGVISSRYSLNLSSTTVSARARRRPTFRHGSFHDDLVNMTGFQSQNVNSSRPLTAAREELFRQQKLEQARRESYMRRFPVYRASSVAESTLQEYHRLERYQAYKRQCAIQNDLPREEILDMEADVTHASRKAPSCILSARNSALKESEKELLRFRPLDLGGFYGELLEAVQFALNAQVRQSKEKVMQAFHM